MPRAQDPQKQPGDADSGGRAKPSSKRRRWPRMLGALAALLVIAVIATVYFLQPTRLTALLLGRASDALKLDLKTSGPGSYALRPEPRLVLPGFSATAPGSKTPFFHSEKVEFALPWDTLRGRSADISSIVLKSPDIDLKGMQSWLATQPPGNKPFKFPTLTRGLQVDDGTLRGDGWRVEHFNLALPSLADAKPMSLHADGNLLRGDAASKFDMTLTAIPAGVGMGLRLDDMHIALKADGELPSLTATGKLLAADAFALDFSGSLQHVPVAWAKRIDSSYTASNDTPFLISVGDRVSIPAVSNSSASQPSAKGLQVQFKLGDPRRQPAISVSGHVISGLTIDAEVQAQLSRWPNAWPGLPPAIAAKPAPLVFHASYRGSIFLGDPVAFDVERADAKLQGKTRIAAVRTWVQNKFSPLLPPVEATLDTPQLDIDGMQLRGVRIDLRDDASPQSPAASPQS